LKRLGRRKNPNPRGYFFTLEESIIFYLETEGFRLANPLIIDLLALILIHILPPEVTSFERQLVRQAKMEVNVVASSGSPRTPVKDTTRGGILPPPPPSPVRTSIFLTPTTSGNGLIPLTASTTILFT